MGWESSDVDGFDLGPILQGQTRITKLKSAYNSLIIGPRGFVMVNQPMGNHAWESFGVVEFDLQGQTRTGKLKSAYNLLIISPRGLLL